MENTIDLLKQLVHTFTQTNCSSTVMLADEATFTVIEDELHIVFSKALSIFTVAAFPYFSKDHNVSTVIINHSLHYPFFVLDRSMSILVSNRDSHKKSQTIFCINTYRSAFYRYRYYKSTLREF